MNKNKLQIALVLSLFVLSFSLAEFREKEARIRANDTDKALKALADELDALEQYVEVALYKKDVQLYLMNIGYGDKDLHKALADSCKADCAKYRAKISHEAVELLNNK